MANHMAEVAKILGVNVGEEFYLKEYPDTACTIFNDRLYTHPIKDVFGIAHDHREVLFWLLTGVVNIRRKPYKPKKDDTYWFVRSDGEVTRFSYSEDIINLFHYKLGNCYRTKEEAETNRDKWLAFYNSHEVLEV